MPDAVPPRRLVVSYARPEAFVRLSKVILSNLGYAILSEAEWRETPGYASCTPELRIVDEARLEDVPRDPAARAIPMILLTGRKGVNAPDPRVIGAIPRPAGLHALFRLIQQALETHPRATPRVETNLRARLRRGERHFEGSVRSLSESGCLLRSPERLHLGAELEIAFELPGVGTIETRAESAYQLIPDLGLVFARTSPEARQAIAGFVEEQLVGV